MTNDVDKVITEFRNVTNDVKSSFGRLSPEQVNWKPTPESWSVGQCLDHLIRSNEEFYSELEKLAAGTRKNTFWQSWSPLSSIAGSFLVSTLKKDGNKVKTNQKMTPPSDIPADIVNRFERHQDEFMEKILGTANNDWNKVILTSPFIKIMTYKMNVGLEALIEHEKRHVRQAKRVVAADGFPGSNSNKPDAVEASV
jgi:hypothetical protein